MKEIFCTTKILNQMLENNVSKCEGEEQGRKYDIKIVTTTTYDKEKFKMTIYKGDFRFCSYIVTLRYPNILQKVYHTSIEFSMKSEKISYIILCNYYKGELKMTGKIISCNNLGKADEILYSEDCDILYSRFNNSENISTEHNKEIFSTLLLRDTTLIEKISIFLKIYKEYLYNKEKIKKYIEDKLEGNLKKISLPELPII